MLFVLAGIECEIFFYVRVVFLEFGEQALVGEIQQMGVLPVLMERLADAADDVLIVDLDGEFSPTVEATRREVN